MSEAPSTENYLNINTVEFNHQFRVNELAFVLTTWPPLPQPFPEKYVLSLLHSS
jgi:hypothetical protein